MVTPIVGIAFSSAGFVLGSISPGLRTLGPHWTETFGATGAERDHVLRVRVLLPAVIAFPIAGLVCDAIGAKSATLLGLLAIGVALTMLAATPKSTINLLGLAVGAAFLAVGSIGWMPSLLGPGRTVQAMNLGFFGIGLGWLAGPMLTRQTLRWLGPRGTLFAAAGLAVVSFAMLARAEGEVVAPVHAATMADVRFWLLAAALVLFVPVECGLSLWTGPFARDLHDRRPHVVRTRIVGFWTGYLAARLVTYWFVRTDFEPWFLLGCVAVCAMALGNLIGVYGSSTGSLVFWLVGFCYGPVLPGLLGLLEGAAPWRFGLAVGVFLSFGAAYQTLISPALHRSMGSPRSAMRVPVVLTLALAAPLLFAILLK